MRKMKTLKILLVSLFALSILPSSLSATQDYEPGFEYDTEIDGVWTCEVCGDDRWYYIDDKEFEMHIIVCKTCAFCYFHSYIECPRPN